MSKRKEHDVFEDAFDLQADYKNLNSKGRKKKKRMEKNIWS
jgi:hypothetical protein